MPFQVIDKSRTPPGGWQYRYAATNWQITEPLNKSFSDAVNLMIDHAKANPTKGFPTDFKTASEYLETYTAKRLNNNPQYIREVDENGQTAQKKTTHLLSGLSGLREGVAHAVNRFRETANGARILADWLGHGGIPVSQAQAEKRAEICSGCKLNRRRDNPISSTVAETIIEHERARHQVELRTTRDVALNTCGHCGCYLKLKVWVPTKYLDQPPASTFPPHCWINKENASRPTITVKRMDAFGDVIMASVVATKIWQRGYDIRFICSEVPRAALEGHPHIRELVQDTTQNAQIDLDGAYERHAEKNVKPRTVLMLEAANKQRPELNLETVNLVPTLWLSDAEKDSMRKRLGEIKRPWVVVIPKSNFWPNRTIDLKALSTAAKMLSEEGVDCIYGGSETTKPVEGFRMPGIRTFREMMALIAVSDLVVTPDTGPLHVAKAFGKQILYLRQCNDPELVLSNQSDWFEIDSNGSECLGCGEFTCPIDAKKPPCQKFDPKTLFNAVMDRVTSAEVSAIIPVHKQSKRLERCLAAIRPQVDEVVVSADANEIVTPDWVMYVHPQAKRTGFGHTCNRGARNSVGKYLLFLNDDCYLDDGAVAKMLECMTDGVAVVGCKLRYPDGTLQHAGTRRDPKGYAHIDYRRNEGSITEPTEMEFVTFAAALVRREAFYQVHGFDEEFDCYCEDSDFCLRVRRAGWKVVYTPLATGIHEESKTTAETKGMMHHNSAGVFWRKWGEYFETNKLNSLGVFYDV